MGCSGTVQVLEVLNWPKKHEEPVCPDPGFNQLSVFLALNCQTLAIFAEDHCVLPRSGLMRLRVKAKMDGASGKQIKI